MPVGEFPSEPPNRWAEFRALMRWRRERKALIREHERRGEKLPGTDPKAGEGLRDGRDSVTWCGHASVLTQLDGRTLLSDPVWSRRIAFGAMGRLTPAWPPWNLLPPVDLVTISHNHYDHLDAGTLRRVRRRATFCVPKGDGRWFRRRGFPRVSEFDWWETQEVAGMQVTYVPSKHFSGRSPWDRDRSRWGGWVVRGSKHAVYHAGDTGYFEGFAEIGRRFPGLDVACVPIGAYEPRWFMRHYHVDPDEAGQAFLDVGARALLPMHWGTFRLTDEAMDEPPLRIRRFFEARGLDPARLWLANLGERFPLDVGRT